MFQASPCEDTVEHTSSDPVHFQPSGNPVSTEPETVLLVYRRWRAGYSSQKHTIPITKHFSSSVKGFA